MSVRQLSRTAKERGAGSLCYAEAMTTGIVDSLTPYKLFQKCGYSGPVMVEPIYPLYHKFETMRAEDVVIEVAAAYKHMENLLRKE